MMGERWRDEKFPNERRNELLYDGIVEDAKRWGCDAIKLLIYWNDEVSENTIEHQRELAQTVGESGVLTGCVVWKKIIDYSDTELTELHLEKTGAGIVERMRKTVKIGQSWYECGSFGGFENILIASD